MSGISRNISRYEEQVPQTPSAYTRGLQFTKKNANLVSVKFAYSSCAIHVDNICFFSFFKDKFSRETFIFYRTEKTSIFKLINPISS